MVQKKAPDKPGSQLQPKKSDKSQSSDQQHQEIRNKGGSDLKKKMKMARLINVSDLESLQGCQSKQVKKPPQHKKPSPVRTSDRPPNFMKPTNSWDARKERLPVSVRPPTATDKNRRPKKTTSNSNNLKLTSSATSGLKHAKVLARKSSLKRLRSLVKKRSGKAVFPIINASRSTCSSSMKDSKFPNALELSPGATEYEGTSVIKVCPYTYCSLNGHKHESLPPLKCFLSARRQLLKTQKSMKLKGIGLSPQRKKVLEKGKEEIYTGQPVFDRVPSIPGVSPMIEEVGDDFFVEIYAKPQVELVNCEDSIQQANGAVHPETLIEVSLLRDVVNGTETEIEEVGDDFFVEGVGDDLFIEIYAKPQAELMNCEDSIQQSDAAVDPETLIEVSLIRDNVMNGTETEIEEVDGDFFVEEGVGDDLFIKIYAKPQAELMNCEDSIQQSDAAVDPETLIEVSLIRDNVMNGTETEIEDSKGEIKSLIEEPCSEISSKDNLDKNIDLSASPRNCIQQADGAVDPETVIEVSLLRDDVMNGTETEIEDGKGENKSFIEEPCSEISSKDNLDENSDLSASEMDVLTTALEYVECHCQAESPQDSENPPCLAQDYVDWSTEECCIPSVSVKIGDGDARVFEAIKMDLEDDLTPCTDDSSDYTKNGSEPCLASLPRDEDTDDGCDEASLDAVAILEPNCKGKNLEIECMIEASTVTSSQDQNQFTDNSDQIAESLESDDGCDLGSVLKVDGNYANNSDNTLAFNDGMVEEPTEDSDPKSKIFLGHFLLREDTNEDVGRVFTDQEPESVDPKTRGNMAASKESLEDSLLGNHIEGVNGNDESKCIKGSQELQLLDYNQDLSDTEDDIKSEMKLENCVCLDAQPDHGNTDEIREKSEDDWCKEFIEIETIKSTSEVEDEFDISDMMHNGDAEEPGEDEICPVDSYKCLEEDAAIISAPSKMDQLDPEPSSDSKTRWCARRNRADMELEELKAFNPRPPHFLPIELDPEAEKVDLKHQMMDERKNAEEWMIDQALQRAVTKLAPARRKKVALLVEAFETVLPPPTYEKPLRQATVGFGHARTMQTCS